MLVRRRPPDLVHPGSWSSGLLLHLLLVFYIITMVSSQSNPFDEKCFVDRKEVLPKRYLTVEGRPTSMQLGVSKSISHQLVTAVLYIYLNEILGYTSVEMTKTDPRDIMGLYHYFNININNSKNMKKWPDNYVNLEVWIPPDVSPVIMMEAARVADLGNIGPPGRYSLYVVYRANSGMPLPQDHTISWRVLARPETAAQFRPSQSDINWIRQSTVKGNNIHYCEEGCVNGVYSPPQCQKETCAMLITNFFELSGFLQQEVEGRGLYVEVAWVGGELESLLKDLKGPVLLAEAVPDPLTLQPNPSYTLSRISLPSCDNYTDDHPCLFYSNRLVKLASSRLKDWAGPAYETLLKIDFDSNDYRELLNEWRIAEDSGPKGDKALFTAACKWLLRHEHATDSHTNHWSYWSTGDEDRKKIKIAGIFPLSPKGELFHLAQGIILGAVMAEEAINNNKEVLRDYLIDLQIENGQCQADLVLKNFIDVIKNEDFKRMAGILGPACSDTIEPLVGVAKHYKTVVISYSAEGSSFSDRSKYPYFFRTIGENKKYKYVYLALLNHLKWKRVASLTEDGTKYTEYISHTETLLQSHNITFIANRKFPTDWRMDTMRQYLEDLERVNARIIIADVNDEAARAVMCEAFRRHMTAKEGYVWFLPLWLSHQWYNTDNITISSRWPGNKFPCSTSEMIQAINGHLSLSHAFFASDNATMQENITVAKWRNKYAMKVAIASATESNYAGYAYDALWVYAYALDKLLKRNHSYLANLHEENATRHFVDLIQKTDFNGVSGRINFKEGSSRDSPINVIQWLNSKSRIVGTFTPVEGVSTLPKDQGKLEMIDEIIWLKKDGEKPWDGTPEQQKCLLSSFAAFLSVDCETAIVIFSVSGFCLLLAVVIIGFIVIKNRYDEKAALTRRIIDALGIDLLNDNTISSLDQWEIPRDNVVINRRLGEGAFGTVYGGEAYFTEKGWVPVAVKTLKVGSTCEEKLDFLSEAEVMKRFEHKNIVKLLGVCTKTEPIYNVMEFMLYGDLKTFLLARRHMVNDKYNDDNEEVSAKKLTQMALDVARALGYLAELKYVHRDVASRNCLINSCRVVKLGDFGMTRPMCENDYYKFNRRGMLPVRWMAPESLGLGIFTHKSDVWSYGVLLYEIVTFGSFPFQGYSNNEVLEYVKQGNTLNIPKNIKPQLESLLKICWKQEAKERPDASEIVELIANNQKLLTPCLDVPLKSVIMEDTGQLEISMEKEVRRRSVGGLAAALRRPSTGSLSATLIGNNLGVTSPDEMHPDGSVIPLLTSSPPGIRYLPLRDMDCPVEYCNHVENRVDSSL